MAEINGWMTVSAAAKEILGVSPQRLHQLIATYKLQTMELNSRMKMVKKAEVTKLAETERPTGVNLDYRSVQRKSKRRTA